MKKILVIGSSGAGKSYFSTKLSEKLNIPVTHLDLIWHKENHTHISREEFDEFLEAKFKEDQWIMDGDYSRTLEVRIEHADTIFFLDYPVEVCVEGIKERVGVKRNDMPWIAEELDESLLNMVENYPQNERIQTLELLKKYKEKNVITFKTREEANKYTELAEARNRNR